MTEEKWRKVKSKSIFAVLAIAIALALTINVVFAAVPTAETASIETTDISGNPQSSYAPGEIVYVHLLSVAPIGTNANIEVRDSANVIVAGPWLNVLAPSALLACGPFAPGDYTVYVNGVAMATIAVATFFVVPESMLGTLTATVAGFAAFATIGIVKRKHAKSK